jgi:hypothetical protein
MAMPSWDRSAWLTTTEMLDRGWARCWLEPCLGEPSKVGSAKLWPRAAVLAAEQHPIFAATLANLAEIAKGVRYVTAEHEERALWLAVESIKAGQAAPAEPIEPKPLPNPAPTEWPKAEWAPDALTLTWECGGKIVVPTAFLEALRKGFGETGERLRLAVSTVLTDWRCGHVKPERFASGRAWFLGWVRNTLASLQQMEGREIAEHEPLASAPDEPVRTLH